MTSYQANNIFF